MKTGGVAGPDGKDHRLIVTETQSTWRSTKQEEDESPEFVFKDGRRWRVDCRRKVWEPGANRGGGGDGEGTGQRGRGGGGGGGYHRERVVDGGPHEGSEGCPGGWKRYRVVYECVQRVENVEASAIQAQVKCDQAG